MKFTFFATDLLVYILLITTILFALWARKKAYWRNAWQRVIHKPLAIITLTILFFYLLAAFLDSIHFQLELPSMGNSVTHYSPQVKSVFDMIVAPIGQRSEKTYSAPFATHLYNKEVIQLPNGKFKQTYLPLSHVGTNFLTHSLYGLLKGGIVWCIIFASIYYWYPHTLAKTVFLLTFAFILIGIFVTHELANAYYIFGTDKVGQDVFYKCLKSIRTGVLIGTLTTLIMLPFALFFGMMAGYFGGLIDDIIQYIYTTLSSIPAVLLIAASVLSIQIFITNHPTLFRNLAAQADAKLLALCIILGISSWTSLCRFLRAETLKLREMDYISAAKVLGVKDFTILVRHILPNVMHIVIITVVLDFSGLVLAEAVLSYVGIGVDPTMMSWGNMINSARLELAREPIVWWPLLSAFIFMFILVLCANIFSDILRDAFDPKK